MKKSQYYAFYFILLFCGGYLLWSGSGYLAMNAMSLAIGEESMTSAIKSGLYGVFGQSFIIVSFAFLICAWLQDK